MEIFLIALSCLALGGSLFLVLDALASGTAARSHGSRNMRTLMREALVSRLELMGHWVPLVRFGNIDSVKRSSERLKAALDAHGLLLTRRGCVAFAVVLMAAAIVLCVIISQSPLGIAVGCIAVGAALTVGVTRYERRLRDARAEQMPEVLRSLSASLGAGKSLPQAIEYVGRNIGDPMGAEFLQASFEIKGGCSVEDAVTSLCERVDAPGVDLLGTALQISQRTGSPLNDLFSRTARMVSDTVTLHRELQVKTSQVRLSSRIVAGIPVMLVCVLVLLSPDYRAGLSLATGRACLWISVLLDAFALWLVQRQMNRSLS